MLIEGADFLSSLFMTVITITTIGYEEYVPLSTAGRIFTIFLALGGGGFFFYMFSAIREFVVHLTLQTFEGRGMEREILKLSDHAILCGFGRIGKNIYELIKEEIPVVVIEKDPALIKELKEKKILHIEGDATEEEVLLKAGVKRARHLIVVLGDDALNVYLVLSARMLNPSINIISRLMTLRWKRSYIKQEQTGSYLPIYQGQRKWLWLFLNRMSWTLSTLLAMILQQAYSLKKSWLKEGQP